MSKLRNIAVFSLVLVAMMVMFVPPSVDANGIYLTRLVCFIDNEAVQEYALIDLPEAGLADGVVLVTKFGETLEYGYWAPDGSYTTLGWSYESAPGVSVFVAYEDGPLSAAQLEAAVLGNADAFQANCKERAILPG